MTDEERIELLREVARVAPKEMGAHVMEDSCPELRPNGISDTCTRFASHSRVLHLLNDIDDACGCFAMLDAVEKAGFNTANSFDQVQSPPVYDCTAYKWPTPDDRQYHNCKGTTRAEAIARAFVAVFKTQESPPPE